jgi:putative nucleotidyltransferase with HDIG domain
MGIVLTEKLKPGMIIGTDVRDVGGRLLLSKSNALRDEHIRIFKIWGINEIDVQGQPDAEEKPPEISDRKAAGVEKKRAQTERDFQLTDLEHPAIRELFRLALACRNERPDITPALLADKTPSRSQLPEPDKDFLAALVERDIALPEIPTIVFELNEVMANPLVSSEQIARVISKSPSLTAMLLRIVNSAFYSFACKIDKVSLAVTLIGTREISGLALGISIISIFKKIPRNIIDMHSFLKHSLACGIIARLLAARVNWPHTEQLFVSGLLHDLGRLIIYNYCPEKAGPILAHADSSQQLLLEAESEFLGCDHAEIGQRLLKQWKLPPILENNVLYHHYPSNAPHPLPATIVHLADLISNALGIGSSGERFVPPLDTDAWSRLEITPSCFEPIARQTEHQLVSLESILSD